MRDLLQPVSCCAAVCPEQTRLRPYRTVPVYHKSYESHMTGYKNPLASTVTLLIDKPGPEQDNNTFANPPIPLAEVEVCKLHIPWLACQHAFGLRNGRANNAARVFGLPFRDRP